MVGIKGIKQVNRVQFLNEKEGFISGVMMRLMKIPFSMMFFLKHSTVGKHGEMLLNACENVQDGNLRQFFSFVSANHGFIVCNGEPASAMSKKVLLYTKD